MEFKSVKPIGVMAVVINEETRAVEAVDVDTLRMMAIVVNHQTKAAQFAFAWGGYDSLGRFHMDPHRPAGHRTLQANVDGEREIWNACMKDAAGNPVLDHGEEFVRKILVDHGKLKDVINGSWDLPDDTDVHHKGKSVFKKGKPKGQFDR